MKKKSTSTMSKFTPNRVPNNFDRSFSFTNFHPKKNPNLEVHQVGKRLMVNMNCE